MARTGNKNMSSSDSKFASPPAPAPQPSKLDRIAGLIGRPDGATLDELMLATGWQRHSVRGAVAGALAKRGLSIVSEKRDGVRRYRIDAR